jgi:hypothetical protein
MPDIKGSTIKFRNFNIRLCFLARWHENQNNNSDLNILGGIYKNIIYSNEFGEKVVLKWSGFSPD